EEGNADYPYGFNGQVYLRGGMDMLQPIGEWNGVYHGSDKLSIGNLFRANALTPFDVYAKMLGFTMQHALSEKTFYDFRLTYIRRDNDAQFYYDVPRRIGGDTVVRWFGNMVVGSEYAVDNIPYGYADIDEEEDQILDAGGSNYGYTSQLGTWNTSWSQTYNASFDMTSQLDRYNQIKFGLSFQYDDLHEYWIANDGWVWPDSGEEEDYSGQQYLYTTYNKNPILMGGYIQDKIEFEGMFANIGVRFDYSDPNTEWPRRETDEDLYSLFYSAYMKDSLFAMAPMVNADASFEISPRLGISFPILEKSKLFFNYGHFYSLPPNEDRYKIIWGDYRSPIVFIGNPSLQMERTISYEVGFESSIASTYLARVSGYYKDTDNEYAEVNYSDYYGDVSYTTVANTGYSDIRGFEFEFRKAQGRFFTGWINYDYRVETSGQIGREAYYQDPVRNRHEGRVIPLDDDPLPRPVFRTQVTFKTPQDWGMFLGGYNLSLLYSWRAGYYDTYNPFGDELEEELRFNIQWPDERNVDISVTKDFTIGVAPVSLFFDIHNVFDWQTLSTQAFDYGNPTDRSDYLNSLRLEMYNEDPWLDNAATDGPAEGENPDKIGDLRSDEKPYINDPNREFLYYLDMRYVSFGIRFSF
ncbi:MAG: TonB-dependent receptor, partial [candidate division WOR-3 bacterium]